MPSAVELAALPRKELQALAKTHGVKANQKNDVIIAQLLPLVAAAPAAATAPAKTGRKGKKAAAPAPEEEHCEAASPGTYLRKTLNVTLNAKPGSAKKSARKPRGSVNAPAEEPVEPIAEASPAPAKPASSKKSARKSSASVQAPEETVCAVAAVSTPNRRTSSGLKPRASMPAAAEASAEAAAPTPTPKKRRSSALSTKEVDSLEDEEEVTFNTPGRSSQPRTSAAEDVATPVQSPAAKKRRSSAASAAKVELGGEVFTVTPVEVPVGMLAAGTPKSVAKSSTTPKSAPKSVPKTPASKTRTRRSSAASCASPAPAPAEPITENQAVSSTRKSSLSRMSCPPAPPAASEPGEDLGDEPAVGTKRRSRSVGGEPKQAPVVQASKPLAPINRAVKPAFKKAKLMSAVGKTVPKVPVSSKAPRVASLSSKTAPKMPVVAAAPRPSVSNRTATKMPRVASLAPSAKPAPVPPAETKPGASTKPLSGVPRVATLAPCTKSRSPKAGKTELVFGQPAPRTNHAAKSKPAAARPATAPPPSSSFGLKGVNRTGYVAPAPFQLKKSVKPLTSSMAPKFSTDQRGEMKKAIKAVAAAEGLVESKERSVAAENTNVVQHLAKESGAGSKQAGAGKTPPRNVKAAGVVAKQEDPASNKRRKSAGASAQTSAKRAKSVLAARLQAHFPQDVAAPR